MVCDDTLLSAVLWFRWWKQTWLFFLCLILYNVTTFRPKRCKALFGMVNNINDHKKGGSFCWCVIITVFCKCVLTLYCLKYNLFAWFLQIPSNQDFIKKKVGLSFVVVEGITLWKLKMRSNSQTLPKYLSKTSTKWWITSRTANSLSSWSTIVTKKRLAYLINATFQSDTTFCTRSCTPCIPGNCNRADYVWERYHLSSFAVRHDIPPSRTSPSDL